MVSMIVGKPYHHLQCSIIYSTSLPPSLSLSLSPSLPSSLTLTPSFSTKNACQAHHSPLTSCWMDIHNNQDKAKYSLVPLQLMWST